MTARRNRQLDKFLTEFRCDGKSIFYSKSCLSFNLESTRSGTNPIIAAYVALSVLAGATTIVVLLEWVSNPSKPRRYCGNS